VGRFHVLPRRSELVVDDAQATFLPRLTSQRLLLDLRGGNHESHGAATLSAEASGVAARAAGNLWQRGTDERQQLLLLRPSDKPTPGKQTDKQSRQQCSDICCNAIGVLLYVPRGVHSINTTAVTSAANQKLLAWACAWRGDRCGFEEEAMLVELHEDTKVIPSEFR
jgi:hypothetical protein